MQHSSTPSARAEAVTRRTYNRPLDDEGAKFETWAQTIKRSTYDHHLKLWEEAGGTPDLDELAELERLGLSRAGTVAGRTLWLGGTDYAYSRACSQFNCSALRLSTVYDMVDAFWLLLNGCGVGGKPVVGTLHGYPHHVKELKIIPSLRDKDHRGHKENIETRPNRDNDYTWTIKIGDSAEAWAKCLGKMLVSPRGKIKRLILDGSEVRGAGGRLKGYGWICNGVGPLLEALTAVHGILNESAENLLCEEQISDVFNWCGTVLSSRRAAEILLLDSHRPYAAEFSRRKLNYWVCRACGSHDTQGGLCRACGKRATNNFRRQSNNSLMFWQRPSIDDIADMLYLNLSGGEPGFVNALAALMRCPWFDVFNPCAEILLASHGFCNLVSLSLPHFGRDFNALERATYVMGRANYRQTCVNLEDSMLQKRWNQTNEALRLCGVSYTGVVQAPWLSDYQIRRLRIAATYGAFQMADELGLPRPKAVTTMKPEGTRSKIAGTLSREIAEGMHNALGRFIYNWINFSARDPMVNALEAAGYKVMLNPSDSNNALVRFPVEYSGCPFVKVDGKEVNGESAVDQLERYKRWNKHWADHNVSATISLTEAEVPTVAKWVFDNWDSGDYIATAFMRKTDPTMTAADMGHPYLPQEVITEEAYREAMDMTRPVDWDAAHTGWYDIDEATGDGSGGCKDGACPVK